MPFACPVSAVVRHTDSRYCYRTGFCLHGRDLRANSRTNFGLRSHHLCCRRGPFRIRPQKAKMIKKYTILSALLLTLTVGNAAEGKQSRFKDALLEGIKLFEDIRKAIHNSVIQPAEQDQALRYLRNLSAENSPSWRIKRTNLLSPLRSRFRCQVEVTCMPTHIALLRRYDQCRRSLKTSSVPYPTNFAGDQLQEKLDIAPAAQSWNLRSQIRHFVTLAAGTSIKEMAQTCKADAKIARRLKLEVDALIEELVSRTKIISRHVSADYLNAAINLSHHRRTQEGSELILTV